MPHPPRNISLTLCVLLSYFIAKWEKYLLLMFWMPLVDWQLCTIRMTVHPWWLRYTNNLSWIISIAFLSHLILVVHSVGKFAFIIQTWYFLISLWSSTHLHLSSLSGYECTEAAVISGFSASNLHMTDGTSVPEILGSDVFFEIIDPRELGFTYRLRPAKDFGAPFVSTTCF